jgi:hypothetical protein
MLKHRNCGAPLVNGTRRDLGLDKALILMEIENKNPPYRKKTTQSVVLKQFESNAKMNIEHTLRRSNTFSHMYFCLIVAPLCCTLSGWTQRVALL